MCKFSTWDLWYSGSYVLYVKGSLPTWKIFKGITIQVEQATSNKHLPKSSCRCLTWSKAGIDVIEVIRLVDTETVKWQSKLANAGHGGCYRPTYGHLT